MRTIEIVPAPLFYNGETLAEALPEVVEQLNLKKYFKIIKNHYVVRSVDGTGFNVPENALIIFPESMGINVKSVKELSFYYDKDVIPYMFFDKGWYNMPPETSEPAEVWTINVNNQLAGYYFPDKRSLLLSDWTHNLSCASVAIDIMPILFKEINLGPITEKMEKPKYIITLGADPEFEMLDEENEVVCASVYLKEKHNSVYTQIGTDGHDSTLEFRPSPATSPEEMIRNISLLMKEFYNEYRTDISAQGDDEAIGFHIHIGIMEAESKTLLDINVTSELIRMFSDFLGKPLRHLNGSARGSYDQVNSYRKNEHGFEYRALSGSILSSPKLTYYCFKIARGIIETYLENIGNKLTYKIPLGQEDYENICGLTKEEYYDFVSISNSMWQIDKYNIIGAWIGEGLKEEISNAPEIKEISKPIIWFKDEWNINVKLFLKNSLEPLLEDLDITIPITLFGINGARGYVSTIPIDGCNLISIAEFPNYHSDLVQGRTIPIGIPKAIRSNSPEYSHEALNNVVDGIINYLKQRDL